MEQAGFHWYVSLLASLTIYTGAFQFVLISFLSSGASALTIAVTALLMNSRQIFYSLTFLEDFKTMGKVKWYMVQTMTDETYAVNCTLPFFIFRGERTMPQWLERLGTELPPMMMAVLVVYLSLYPICP